MVLESTLLLLFYQVEFMLVGATFLAYAGAGRFGPMNIFDQAFLGYCIVTTFAQIWSIFSGLYPISNYFLIGGTLILAILKRRCTADSLCMGLGVTRFRTALLLVPIGLAVAYNAITIDFCYDNELYHLLSVRWLAEYGSVPGLANLHGRLGFNSSLTALAGIFSVPFGVSFGREFVNGAMSVLVAGVLVQGLKFEKWRALDASRNLYAFGLLSFVVTLVLSRCLSSPQPDVGSALIAIVSAWYLFTVVKLSRHGEETTSNQLLLCVSASVAAFELKLSYIVYAIVTIFVVVTVAVRRRVAFPQLCLCLIFSLILLVPWISCGYITSGCPFFPSDFGRLNFDWAVSPQLAGIERDAALAWARAPGLSPTEVLGNWKWLTSWSARILGDPVVVKSLLAGVVGLLLLLGRLLVHPLPQIERRWFILLVPSSAGLLFWLFTAPDPRFAQATLWVFALNFLLLPFHSADEWTRRLNILTTLALIIVTLLDAGVGWARLKKEKKNLPNTVQHQHEFLARSTDSGLIVWIPKDVYEPGDAQLIATPPDRFNSHLEMRGSNLRQGFRIGYSNR